MSTLEESSEVLARRDRTSLVPAAICGLVFLAIASVDYVLKPLSTSTYWFVAFGPVVFVLTQVTFPAVRFRPAGALSPSNWMWILFFVQLVAIPSALLTWGPTLGQLTALPPTRFIAEAFVVQCLSFIAYSLGFEWVTRRPPRTAPPELVAMPSLLTALVFIGLGLVGIALTFRSPAALLSYLSGHFVPPHSSGASASLAAVAGTFLKPFGAYGFILLWARTAQRATSHRIQVVAYAAGALLILSTYSYNRSALVIPLVAMVSAYSTHIRRISLPTLVVAGSIVLIAALLFGQYRSTQFRTEGGRVTPPAHVRTDATPSSVVQLEIYGQAPQFQAIIEENLGTGGSYRLGQTVLPEVFSPIPKIGRIFRSSTATQEYNQLIYQNTTTADQIAPFEGEMVWNFTLIGELIAMIILGSVLARFHRRFMTSTSVLDAYILQYLALWLGMLVVESVLDVSQVIIYFTLPIAVLWLIQRPKRRSSSASLLHVGHG